MGAREDMHSIFTFFELSGDDIFMRINVKGDLFILLKGLPLYYCFNDVIELINEVI